MVDAATHAEEDFAALFAESLQQDNTKEGEILRGTVISVGKDYAIVDIGYKSEGQVPLAEFTGADGLPTVKEGDLIEVFLESRENENGLCVLSKEKADRLKVWDEISAACERDELIEGTIAARVKGGLSVGIKGGVKAFLPGSQVDLRPVRNLDSFIGKNYKFKVIKFNKKRGNIVLSRRVLLEKERAELKEQTLEKLTEGQIVEGIVKNLTEYGAFIDLGGIDGLLHITDMSWGRVNHPSELFQVGDKVKVKVLKFNSESERVSLGLKQITDDPWINAEEKYIPGTVVQGKVVSIKDYGAFVELEEGIEGLVHVSEMSWTRQIKNPKQILKIGDEVRAVVLDIDVSQNRISLGMKQCKPNPWEEFSDNHRKNDKVRGTIKSITDFGVFIGLSAGIDGLVHLSDLSWNEPGEAAVRNYKKGQEVEAIVLAVDVDRERISLGIKQLDGDPFTTFVTVNDKGQTVTGKVKTVDARGAEIDLGEDIVGYLRASEISRDRVEDARNVLKEGDEVTAVVVNVDRKTRNIQLSIKAKDQADQQEAMASLSQQSSRESAGTTSLGALLRAKLDNKGE